MYWKNLFNTNIAHIHTHIQTHTHTHTQTHTHTHIHMHTHTQTDYAMCIERPNVMLWIPIICLVANILYNSLSICPPVRQAMGEPVITWVI